MPLIDEQVIDFYYDLFDGIFTKPFRPKIKERLRQDAVARQVEEAAGAASQALTRFFLSEQLTESQVEKILQGFKPLHDQVKLDDIANPNRTPEALVEELLKSCPCPAAIGETGSGAVYRVALHLTVQVLMLVGPVMTEWQKLSFSSTYEMLRRIVSQLNQISEGLRAFASAGQAAADERFELAYRDHLLQRFYRVEAGTVRMTTNLNVDLRELFVMPRLTVRAKREDGEGGGGLEAEDLMTLKGARDAFGEGRAPVIQPDGDKKEQGVVAVERVKDSRRNVIIGLPGSGKSTFLEWLQLSVANVDEVLEAGGGQAIPLLLRVRQFDPTKPPRGAELIEKATASRDRATLMPDGWIDRQMKAGRVLFMLDGLDETEPGIRDNYLLPWLADLCEKYPDCLYLVSSRPVGYPPGALRKLNFAECELQDFREPEIAQYTRHWCTAIRLAQNDPDEEARREGAREGEQIVAGFRDHPYIRNLARNPLMLSAVCLVNYFEGGQLPKDRAVLYKLCVEGLLHHWDQRRGIHSEYSLEEKLRVCREVAVAMQSDDRAEYESAKVLTIFTHVLRDKARAESLLEHIRYRTGLLIERRAGVFAFAHLTFQEYLAARAAYEGNHLKIDADQLAREHADGRWKEVIALYCGLAPAKAAREMIENLIRQPDTRHLSEVLAEAFLSTSTELSQDAKLRRRVLERLAIAPASIKFVEGTQLSRLPTEEVAPIANSFVGKTTTNDALSESYYWLNSNSAYLEGAQLVKPLREWRKLTPVQACELVYLAHRYVADKLLSEIATKTGMYEAPGPNFEGGVLYVTQAEIALLGLSSRVRSYHQRNPNSQAVEQALFNRTVVEQALLQVLRVISRQETVSSFCFYALSNIFRQDGAPQFPKNIAAGREFISLTRQIATIIEKQRVNRRNKWALSSSSEVISVLREWADRLESSIAGSPRRRAKSSSEEGTTKTKRRAATKRSAKKPTRQRSRS